MEDIIKKTIDYVEKNSIQVFSALMGIIVFQFIMIIYFCLSSKSNKEEKTNEKKSKNINNSNITNMQPLSFSDNKSNKNVKDNSDDKKITEGDDEESVVEERENSFKMKLKEEEERLSKHNKNVQKKLAKKDRKARSEEGDFTIVKNGKY